VSYVEYQKLLLTDCGSSSLTGGGIFIELRHCLQPAGYWHSVFLYV